MEVLEAIRVAVEEIKQWVDEDKVQKINGKDLSTNDYTDEDKRKVGKIDDLPNDLVILNGELCLAKDGVAIQGTAVTIPVVEEKDPTVPAWAKTPQKPKYTYDEVGADPAGTASNAVSTHNTQIDAHNDIRIELQNLANRINTILDSDDATLDQMSEIVAYIKSNKTLIDAITTSKVSVADIVDNLTTNVANKPLSAAQGVVLKNSIPTKLPNPNMLTINGTSYDGSSAVNVNIDNTVDEETVNDLIDIRMNSVNVYGAKGDGVTDDTAAFQDALANERVVFVPGGTYVLTDTLVIRENCCLELSQDAVLNFTTDVNAITMLRSASLRGNHATIFVPYVFNHNVINCDNGEDYNRLDKNNITVSNINAVPPFKKWDPQWKTARYVTDINICKPTYVSPGSGQNGFHYSLDGTCCGNGIYIHCDEADHPVSNMWGVSMSGVRIAGNFNYGIRIHNLGSVKVSWNHDMRIEAVIEGCKIGVSVENCLCSRLAITFQPHRSVDKKVGYAEHGIELINSPYTDLSSTRIWDWITKDEETGETVNSKWEIDNEYQHIALYGNCSGLILDDYLYYSQSTFDIRKLIYTDTPSNLEKMTILQEPITRWFKLVDGEPYFSDGSFTKKLLSDGALDPYFQTDIIKGFTDVLPTAIDKDGSIYNGIGYMPNRRVGTGDGVEVDSAYYVLTGFIPCTKGTKIYAKGMSFATGEDNCGVRFYDANFNVIYYTGSDGKEYPLIINRGMIVNGSTTSYLGTVEMEDDGFVCTVGNGAPHDTTAYVRFCIYKSAWGDRPMIAIDEKIEYVADGFLADGIKVKAENVIGAGDGLSTDDVNNLIDAKLVGFVEPADGEYVQIEKFANVKSPYQENVWCNGSGVITAVANSIYIEPRAFNVGDVIRIRGINFTSNYPGKAFVYSFNKSDGSYNTVSGNMATLIGSSTTGNGHNNDWTYIWDTDTNTLTITFNGPNAASCCSKYTYAFGGAYASGYNVDSVIMTVNEEIITETEWRGEPKRLDESVYAQSVMLKSPNGTIYKLVVDNDGKLTTSVL